MKKFFREYTPGEKEGEVIERELLGVVKNVKSIEEERGRVKEIMKNKNISEFKAAIEDIKEKQIGNPTSPRQPFADLVRTEIFDVLEDLQDDTKLKFYTAVSGTENKTVLDRDFGVDAFFELEKEKEESIIIPIDLTLKQFKENPKVMIFSLPDDFPTHAYFDARSMLAGLSASEEKIFRKYAEDLAKQIADKIKRSLAV